MNEALRDWVTNVRRHLLLIGTRRRPAPLSGHGPRLPVGDRRRGQASRCWRRRAGCRTRWSPRSAAARTPWACSTPSSTTRGAHRRPSRRRATASRPASTPPPSDGGRPGVLHGARSYLLQDADGQVHRGALDLGRPRLSGHRPRAFLAQGHRAASRSRRPPTTRRWRRSSSAPRLEGILPALERSHALAEVAKQAPRTGEGPDPGHESLRPRRQGHLHHRAGHGRAAVSDGRIEARFAELRAEPAARASSPSLTAGDPDLATSQALIDGPAGGRRRPDRDRHAVHRPDGRRPRHPGRRAARAARPAPRCPAPSTWCAASASATTPRRSS